MQRDSSNPRFLGTSYMRPHDLTQSNQILHDQTRGQENFHRLDHAPALAELFVPQMLTRDLFTVAKPSRLQVVFRRMKSICIDRSIEISSHKESAMLNWCKHNTDVML